MSGNRKILRDRVRKHLKKAKNSIPPEQRGMVTFSSVFNILKASERTTAVRGMAKDIGIFDEQGFLPKQEEQADIDESSSFKQITDI